MIMKQLLNRRWLGEHQIELEGKVEVGSLREFPVKILQFGEGNFLRSFVDWMVCEANCQGKFGGGIAVAQPIERGMAAELEGQGNVYTVLMRGIHEGEPVEKAHVVTSIAKSMNPYESWGEMVALATSPDLRFVVSNTTEAGISYSPEAHTPGSCQKTFPAKVAALLFERFKKNEGGRLGGLIFLPCELIDRNGDHLKKIVLRYAGEWALGKDFEKWLDEENVFTNTLVDRIVPGYPKDEIGEIEAKLGYVDPMMSTGEIFHLWVIEGPAGLARELPLHEAGLNVVWTDNLERYRTRKVRILNGGHTMSVLAAYLCGVDSVREMMEDADCSAFLKKGLMEEILPVLNFAEEEKRSYAKSVLERFANPYIKHLLLSISLNSVSKFKVRVLPSLLESMQLTGKIPRCMAFSLAALFAFYRGTELRDGALLGKRGQDEYKIMDGPEVLDVFAQAWIKVEKGGAVRELVANVLANASFWGEDLTAKKGLCEEVAVSLESIIKGGMRSALQSTIR